MIILNFVMSDWPGWLTVWNKPIPKRTEPCGRQMLTVHIYRVAHKKRPELLHGIMQ